MSFEIVKFALSVGLVGISRLMARIYFLIANAVDIAWYAWDRLVCFVLARLVCGAWHIRYVARARGSAVMGCPSSAELNIVVLRTGRHERVMTLARGHDIPPVPSDKSGTEILAAALTVTSLEGESHTHDVTLLCYRIPEEAQVTPLELSRLVIGYECAEGADACDLKVTTLDMQTTTFYAKDTFFTDALA